MNGSLVKDSESATRERLATIPTREPPTPPPRKQGKPWIADIALIGVAVIWGVNIPVMKYALDRMDAFAFNALRLSCSAAVLGICVWLERRRGVRKADHSRRAPIGRWVRIGIYCALTGAFYQMVFVMGMDRTTSGNTALIVSAMPMWAAVIGWLFARERLTRLAQIGLLTTFFGTMVVTFQRGGLSADSLHLWGNMLVLVATLAWASASVLSRSVFDIITPTALAFLACISTLPVHFLAAGPSLLEAISVTRNSPLILIGLIYSGSFSTGIAYALWNYGVRQVGASHAAVFQNLVPVIALLVSWLFLSEVPAVVQAIGGVLIIGGLVIMRRGRPG